MRGLPTSVFLILVNVCAALENIEFKLGGRKIKVPLNRPIHVTNVKGADLADLKFSIPKLVELLPFVAEGGHRIQHKDNAPNTRLPSDTFSNQYKTKNQFQNADPASSIIKLNDLSNTHMTNNFRHAPSENYTVSALSDHLKYSIKSPESTTRHADLSDASSYDVLPLNPAANAAQSSYTTPPKEEKHPPLPEPPLIQEITIHEQVAIPFSLAESLPAVIQPTQKPSTDEKITPMSKTIIHQQVIAPTPLLRLAETTKTAETASILTDIDEPFMTPLPLVKLPAVVVETDKVTPTSILKANLYFASNKTREIPITLHYFTPRPRVPQVTSSSTLTALRSYKISNPHPVVTSPSIESLPLFPGWRLNNIMVTPYPVTTPVSATIPELDLTSKSDTSPASVSSVEPEAISLSGTLSDTMRAAGMSSETVHTPVLDRTPMSETTKTNALVKSLSIASIPLFSAWTTMTSKSDSATVPVLSPDTDTTPVLETILMPKTSTDLNKTPILDTMSVTVTTPVPDATPVSDKTPVLETSVTTSKLGPLVTSPLIASIPLFPEWRLYNYIVTPLPDTTPRSAVQPDSVVSPETDVTQASVITLVSNRQHKASASETVTNIDPATTPASDTLIVFKKSLESTLISDTPLATVPSTESDAIPLSEITTVSGTSLETDLGTVSDKITEAITINDTVSVLDTTLPELNPPLVSGTMPVPVTLAKLGTTPALDISSIPDATYVIKNVASVLSSPLVTSKSNTTPKLRPLVTSQLIISVTPDLETIPVVDRMIVLSTSPEIESMPVANTTPLVGTSPETDTIKRPDTKSMLATSNSNVPSRIDKSVVPLLNSNQVLDIESDTSSVSDTMLVLDTSTDSSTLLVLDTMLELVTLTGADTVLDTTPMLESSTLSDTTPAFDIAPELVTSIGATTEPISDTTPDSGISTMRVRTLVSDTTPVPETFTESDTKPLSDTTLELVTETVPMLDTTPASGISTERDQAPAPDATLELMTSIGTGTVPISDTMPVPMISTERDLTTVSDTTPMLESSILSDTTPAYDITPELVTSIGARTEPISDTTPESGISIERDLVPVSGATLELMTSIGVGTVPTSDTTLVTGVTSESYTIPVPVPYLMQESISVQNLDTIPVTDGNSEQLTSPEKTPASDSTSLSVSILESAKTQESNKIPVPVILVAPGMKTMSDAASGPVTLHMPDTTSIPMTRTDTDTIPVSDTMLEAATSPEPASQLDTARIPDTTVMSSLVSETTASPLTTTIATVSSPSYSITNGTRLTDKVTPSRTPITTTKVACVRRKSTKKKARPGRRCRKSRSAYRRGGRASSQLARGSRRTPRSHPR